MHTQWRGFRDSTYFPGNAAWRPPKPSWRGCPSYDSTFGGGLYDGFVARLDLLPAGATKYAVSTPGCAGPLAIGVTSWPQVGNGAFALTCTNAPPLAAGHLGIAFAPASPLFFVAGVLVALDPLATLFLDVSSDPLGGSEVPIPIPASPPLVGAAGYAQFFWADPCAPGGVSASNALEIVIQP
jgi:hypothetical protein